MALVNRKCREARRRRLVNLRLGDDSPADLMTTFPRVGIVRIERFAKDASVSHILRRERRWKEFRGLLRCRYVMTDADCQIVAGISSLDAGECPKLTPAGIEHLLRNGLVHIGFLAHFGCFENTFVHHDMLKMMSVHGQNLQELDLSSCIMLKNLELIGHLANLKRLGIEGCWRISASSVLKTVANLPVLEYLKCDPKHVSNFFELKAVAKLLLGVGLNGTIDEHLLDRLFENFDCQSLQYLSFAYCGCPKVIARAAGTRYLQYYGESVSATPLIGSGTQAFFVRDPPQLHISGLECISMFDEERLHELCPFTVSFIWQGDLE